MWYRQWIYFSVWTDTLIWRKERAFTISWPGTLEFYYTHWSLESVFGWKYNKCILVNALLSFPITTCDNELSKYVLIFTLWCSLRDNFWLLQYLAGRRELNEGGVQVLLSNKRIKMEILVPHSASFEYNHKFTFTLGKQPLLQYWIQKIGKGN